MLKIAWTILALVLVSHVTNGQCGAPPDEFYLVEEEDYREHEGLCFQLMNCLVLKPTELTDEKTAEAEAFCMMWLSGTPDYRVEVSTEAALFIDEKPEYFYIYIFAMALVEKDFPEYTTIQKESEALYLISQYEISKYGSQIKILKKVDKLYRQGKLETYLEKIKEKN